LSYSKFFYLFIIFFFILNQNNISFKKFIKDILKIKDISIIIPIFNSEKYLSLCLNSIINQSIKNIEIICIDDGSSDKSLQILKEYKRFDKRIIIIHHKNKGSGISRNTGIKISKGKFLAFMDSDDLYPDKFILEFMLINANKNKALICGGGAKHFYQIKKEIILLNNTIKFINYGLTKYYNYQYDYYYQRFIYKKNFIKKNKLYFPNYLRFQDPPFFIKTMAIAKNFFALKNITYLHRISNKIKILNERKINDIYKGINQCLDISKSMHLYKLYCRILSRLNSKFIINNAKKFIKRKKLKYTISLVLKKINYDIIKKENYKFKLNKFYLKLKEKNLKN